jgi:hypothetical protein
MTPLEQLLAKRNAAKAQVPTPIPTAAPETPKNIPAPTVDSILDPAAVTGQYTQVQANILSLQSALLSQHPSMPTLLHQIHKQLKNDPATVTLLTEDEIRSTVQGLEAQTNTVLAESLTKTSSAKSKSLSKVSSSDLGF